MTRYTSLLVLPLLLACGDDAPEPDGGAAGPAAERAPAAAAGADDTLAVPDTAVIDLSPGDSVPEAWEDITAESVNRRGISLPLQGDVSGPSVLEVQTLLDRTRFSPGIIDGHWGMNTRKALRWYQDQSGLEPTGVVDEATYRALLRDAGDFGGQVVKRHRLSAEDVAGPFVRIPEDVYDQAEMDCLCYESLPEKLGELFHTSPEVLAQLNPGVALESLGAGDEIQVPNVRDVPPPSPIVRLVISDTDHYVHALDAEGRIVYHFPSTLGSEFSPSPSGRFKVTAIAWDPTWHYQPELLEGIPDHEEDAVLPKGPNNAVGVVWMQLSKENYGIHGTNAPETIGYAVSNGCVRLTNWDARRLGRHIEAGVPVQFVDVG